MKTILRQAAACFLLFFACLPLVQAQEDEDYAASILGGSDSGETEPAPMELFNYFSNDPLGILDSMNAFRANFGVSVIDGQQYVGTRLRPDISIGKFGIGLDLPILFNLETGDFRNEEFARGVGVLRLIRYARHGRKKRDPFFLKVGDLTGSHLGYGLLLNNYTNETSFERRKIGISTDLLIAKVVGIEAIYSDVNPQSFNLLALRPYVRPFGRSKMPIVRTLELGGSYISDRDDRLQRQVVSEEAEQGQQNVDNVFVDDGFAAWGADLGITFLNVPFVRITGAIQYAKLLKSDSDTLNRYFEGQVTSGAVTQGPLLDGYQAGDGLSIGLSAHLNFLADIFEMDARIERLWYSEHFIPQFFSAVYELNKDRRIRALGQASGTQGIYGVLSASIIDKIRISGGLLMPDQISETSPALVQVNAEAHELFDKIFLAGSYIKGDLTTLEDAFTLDERSLVRVRAAYKVYKFLQIGADYYWSFLKNTDGTYRPAHYFMPYFGLNIPLNFGNQPNNLPPVEAE